MNETLGGMNRGPDDMLENLARRSDREAEQIVEREVMTKARQLFDYPEPCDARHRPPDIVQDMELVVEKISYLKDKDDPDKPLLTYRRLYIKRNDQEELDLNSQMLEYTEWGNAVPTEMFLPNRFAEADIDAKIMTEKIGTLLDKHLSEHTHFRQYSR